MSFQAFRNLVARGELFGSAVLVVIGVALIAWLQRSSQSSAYRRPLRTLAVWKDADPDIPILKEAKAEYAKLQ